MDCIYRELRTTVFCPCLDTIHVLFTISMQSCQRYLIRHHAALPRYVPKFSINVITDYRTLTKEWNINPRNISGLRYRSVDNILWCFLYQKILPPPPYTQCTEGWVSPRSNLSTLEFKSDVLFLFNNCSQFRP
jgi:hypothetical protein